MALPDAQRVDKKVYDMHVLPTHTPATRWPGETQMSKVAKAEVYDFRNQRPLPDTMPLRDDLTRADMAFPTASGHLHSGGAYLDFYQGQCGLVGRQWTDIASALFFNGGKIEDFGLRLSDGLDAAAVRANLHWLLGSFSPKHQEKEATVGFAISKWFERVSAQAEAA